MAYIGRSVTYGNFEVQLLTPDSTTTTFNLTYGVGAAGSILVVYGGIVQLPGTSYSIGGGGNTIVFSQAPVTGTTLYLVYLGKQLSVPRTVGGEVVKQSETGDGTTTTWTLNSAPATAAGVLVFVDGLQQREGSGNNFVCTGSSIIFSTAPDSGAEIDFYVLSQERISVDVVVDGSITTPKLADASVTIAKLAPDLDLLLTNLDCGLLTSSTDAYSIDCGTIV